MTRKYKYKYKYLTLKYKYKYLTFKYKYFKSVLEYRSSTSTSTKYYKSANQTGGITETHREELLKVEPH